MLHKLGLKNYTGVRGFYFPLPDKDSSWSAGLEIHVLHVQLKVQLSLTAAFLAVSSRKPVKKMRLEPGV